MSFKKQTLYIGGSHGFNLNDNKDAIATNILDIHKQASSP